jgi:hypothetical protein
MSEHLNLAVNGLLRDIDTMVTCGKPINHDAFKAKMQALRKCIVDHPDLDIPNNVFVGVSNITRQMCVLGGAFVTDLSVSVLEDFLKQFKPDQN